MHCGRGADLQTIMKESGVYAAKESAERLIWVLSEALRNIHLPGTFGTVTIKVKQLNYKKSNVLSEYGTIDWKVL